MVKPGYKQTEVGLIPEDWTVANFGSKVKIFRGGSPRPIQDYLTQADDGVNWIKIGDVREGDKYITATEEKIIPEGVSRSRTVHAGDFILSNSMSFGRPYILNINGCIHDGWLTIQEYEKTFSKDFLYYLLSSDSVYQQYISMAAGSSVKNLNKEKVSALVVAYPQIGEQEKIAEALSRFDSLVAYLEKEITKKKTIKQGAMQELLTGRKRLPGFSGAWQHSILGNSAVLSTATISTKQIDSRHYVGTDNMVADKGGVRDNEISLTYPNVREYIVGDVLLSNIRPYLKKIWHATRNGGCSNDVLVIRSKDSGELNSSFLYYLLSTDAFFDEIMANAVGTKMPRGDKAVIRSYAICYPKDILEQKAIAKILSNMDAEIEALQQKLEKYRQLKQGMMQQLLTGKIRLV